MLGAGRVPQYGLSDIGSSTLEPDRIATAIGRSAARPVGLDAVAPCASTD
jgi:hypothetical protein